MARTKQTARLIEGSFEPFFLICLFYVDMSFIKRAVLRTDSDPVEHPEESEASRLAVQQE